MAQANSPVVATVDGQPVHAAEVEAELRQAYGDRDLAPEARERHYKAALEQVIERRVVFNSLAKSGEAASKNDVSLALAQFEKELAAQNLTLKQHCEKVGLSEDDLRRGLEWKVSWKRYCEKRLTPQNLEKYFQQHRREFDGTQLKVAQILLPFESAVAGQAALEQAQKVRADIVAGKVRFADAARQHSTAPSRENGGDIGWIERHKPMPEDFSSVAFALKKGEVSQPFTSQFGLHLVTVVEEKPGSKTWQDVQEELRPAMIAYLFGWLADRGRAGAKIEYVPAAK